MRACLKLCKKLFHPLMKILYLRQLLIKIILIRIGFPKKEYFLLINVYKLSDDKKAIMVI